ncbi:cardiotrophin-1 [Spea bombifrons]|uniref:cardiotrophin-1 n=1 Tax=Spea bombifrons TaxID=233779 RepID=UPI00234A7823|nr:cardiotrophin-1 [Spea bombifrons]
MEVLRVDHLAGIPSAHQEDDKEDKRQALRLVLLLKSESEGLVSEYLRFQGPPFSTPGFNSTAPVDGLPTPRDLPASLWKRLPLCLSAFTSLAGWFAAVLAWQKELNPGAVSLHRRLEASQQQARALCSSLAAILGQPVPGPPAAPAVSRVIAQKIAGYVACLSYVNWLTQTERDLALLVCETAV